MSLNSYENNLTKKKNQNQKIVIKLPHKHIPFSWKTNTMLNSKKG